MASTEVTGATKSELKELEGRYYNTPQWEKHRIPFEVAYCLNPIARQPDGYDGPERFCKRRVAKKDPDEYEGSEKSLAAFCKCCPSHGGHVTKHGKKGADKLENPLTAAIKHGSHAEDEHLMMDFTDEEQKLYDRIMDEWPEIYDWPPKSEDPARYRLLRRIAVNEVRGLRQEEYLDDRGEVYIHEVMTETGPQEEDRENPLSRECRLLMKEITNQMRELGLTPKARQQMDTAEAEERKNDAVADIAGDALHGDDTDYDPTEFE